MSDKSTKLRVVKDSRHVVTAITAAAGFMRSISIKRFVPKLRRREFDVIVQNQDSHRMRCSDFPGKRCRQYTDNRAGLVLYQTATETVEFPNVNCYASMVRSTM